MAPAAQPLPTRFPCWCRATYSWGGETKRDLGFIEGDLIECLNAGDGSWWMGRLKRDRRMVGLFPSNFVEVLDEAFQPWNRTSSLLSKGSSGGSVSRTNTPTKQTPTKTKSMFRKPFSGYAAAGAPNPAAAAREIQQKNGGLSPNPKQHKPYSSMKRSSTESRDSPAASPSPVPSPAPRATPARPHYARAVSPAPPAHSRSQHRQADPLPPSQSQSHFRAVSPAPPMQYQQHPRAVSPAPSRYQYEPRAVSPAPPAHYQRQPRAISPAPPRHYQHQPRAVSPAPPAQYQYQPRAISPAPPRHYQRAASPAPPMDYQRAASPAPPMNYQRAASPAPPMSYQRAASPAPPTNYQRAASPAPPMNYQRAASPAPPMNYQRAASPAPPMTYQHRAQAVSPAPSRQFQHEPRGMSPAHYNQHRAVSPAPPSPAPPSPYNQHRAVSPAPPAHYDQYRAASPAPPSHYAQHRAISPAPPSPSPYQRQRDVVSPAPPAHFEHENRSLSPIPPARSVSPAPSFQYQPYSRGTSPRPYGDSDQPYGTPDSPPPPPPPPHRVAYEPNRTPSPAPAPFLEPQYATGYQTPAPPSPDMRPTSKGGFTPSPLTNAMNDVMSSLKDMSMSGTGSGKTPEEPSTPPGIWSPEAFDQVYEASKRVKAQTSQGLGSRPQSVDEDEAPPQVHSYVQRMESRLRRMQQQDEDRSGDELFLPGDQTGPPPAVPPKNTAYQAAKQEEVQPDVDRKGSNRLLRHRKSAYELSQKVLGRTFTTKTTSTTTTDTSNSTNRSLMSGRSATNMSVTSAGSYYRKKLANSRPLSVMNTRDTAASKGYGFDDGRPETPFTGVSYHSSHDSNARSESRLHRSESRQNRSESRLGRSESRQGDWAASVAESKDPLGGLTTLKPKKSGFFRKVIETAKTTAATARSTIAASQSRPGSRAASRAQSRAESRASRFDNGSMEAVNRGFTGSPVRPGASRDMGTGGSVDWLQVRRDVNRANTLSKNEKFERAERCQMMDIPVISPIDILHEAAEGDEGLDGLPITEPTDFATASLGLVDKSARFINSTPLGITPATLAQGYICRPYRTDVQRLRAIFTWVSERIAWEEDFEGEMDTRHVIQTKRGCSQEIALVVAEMCASVGLHSEIIRGYLKTPGEPLDLDAVARPNHFWNAVIVEGEWRILDCSLAGPTNPKRTLYSSAGSQTADSWYFLTRPMEICYTHVALLPEQQHICPPQPHEVLMALPCACPTYFKHKLRMVDYNTSLLMLEELEMAHIYIDVPEDVECVAEVEARVFSQDADGDYFESGDVVKKPALAQAEWVGGQKRYTVKALLPGDEGQGVLKIYAGPRGLMHSNKYNPHSLALGLPIRHTGTNPPFSFLTLHPTPHAQRHDLYVGQPQCARLAQNNTFVFNVRQHPSSLTRSTDLNNINGRASPDKFARPASAMSMQSISVSGSAYSHPSTSSTTSSNNPQKPAKLAIQTPTGKIIRLLRKSEVMGGLSDTADGSVWETVIKIGEKGTWRGLVLADRSARWCVFAEWECV